MSHTLDSLRTSINQIDNDIIALLKQRMALAKQVGLLKSNSQQTGLKSYLRPAREAAVIRKALVNNQGDYPDLAIYAIWRQIMASCVHNEQPLTLLGHAPTENSQSAPLAKAYFGDFPNLTLLPSAQEIIDQIKQNPPYIGIFPVQSKGWWLPLKEATTHQIRIFAALPFVSSQEETVAVAVSTIDLEPTDQDQTWCCITLTAQGNSGSLEIQLNRIQGQLLEKHAQEVLIQVPGFHLAKDDQLWTTLKTENEAIQEITPLGCHPSPIRITT